MALKSDHSPLLLNTNPPKDYLARPFHFESMWTLHPETGTVIQEAWIKGFSMVSKLKNTKIALKEWNQRSFGRIQRTIKHVKELIKSVQDSPDP